MVARNTTISKLQDALATHFPRACGERVLQRHPHPAFLDPPSGDQRSVPTAAITEIVGAVGTGRSSFAIRQIATLHAQANATATLQKDRPFAAFIDLSGELYPPAAAQLGVLLQRLLIVRPTSLSQALKACEILVRGGAARIIVLDLPPGTPPLRLSTYHRLRRRVRTQGVTFLVLCATPMVPADCRITLSSHE
jgi:recombination protein RecA